MPKQARLNGIKSLRCYTIEEAAEVTGVSPRTIRSWIKRGLQVLDGERPHLIRGDRLSAHIRAQRSSHRVRLRDDQFYCVRCRKPRTAAGKLAECTVTHDRAALIALCSACGTVLTKPVALARLPVLRSLFDLTIRRPDERL